MHIPLQAFGFTEKCLTFFIQRFWSLSLELASPRLANNGFYPFTSRPALPISTTLSEK
jgi:hypothetical protein